MPKFIANSTQDVCIAIHCSFGGCLHINGTKKRRKLTYYMAERIVAIQLCLRDMNQANALKVKGLKKLLHRS